ncbi:MAG TPA: dTMP kinase [Candidatus Dormibacteraeota bacterium]|nr:dTMP kinase [Candidatus Dormibacteraeota bacterium]
MAVGRGFFISFEGLDGAGKSTQVAALGAALRADGYDVVTVRPNDTPLGDLISGVVLQHQVAASLHPWSEALLFNAGRVQLLAEVIRPALATGTVVIADRYADSTLAYQGGGRGLEQEALLRLHRDCCEDLWPDLTVYLDLEYSVAVHRQHAQQLPLDRIEGAPDEFHDRVRATFDRLAAEHPERIVRVDSGRSAVAVSQDVTRVVRERLEAAEIARAVAVS